MNGETRGDAIKNPAPRDSGAGERSGHEGVEPGEDLFERVVGIEDA